MGREGRDGLVVAGLLLMLLFSFYSVIFSISSILSSTLLQHSIFEESKRIFWSDVQNTSTTEC